MTMTCAVHTVGSRIMEKVKAANKISRRRSPGRISRLAGAPLRPCHNGVVTRLICKYGAAIPYDRGRRKQGTCVRCTEAFRSKLLECVRVSVPRIQPDSPVDRVGVRQPQVNKIGQNYNLSVWNMTSVAGCVHG